MRGKSRLLPLAAMAALGVGAAVLGTTESPGASPVGARVTAATAPPHAAPTTPAEPPATTTTTSPATTTTTTTASTVGARDASWAVPPSEVAWSTVAFPVDDGCGPGQEHPWVVAQETAMTPPNGPELAILLVHCRTTTGGPPDNLLVYDGASSAASPDYLTTLMAWPNQDYLASGFSVSGTTISMGVWGYSTTSVPRCCPNVRKTLRWTWAREGFQPR